MKKALIMVALLSAFSVRTAQALTEYQLTVDNCTGGCNPGPPGTSMGTVTLTQFDADTVTVTVALVAPLRFVNTGLQETIDFNLSGSAAGVTATNFSNANFSLSSQIGGNHFDGFGDFQFAILLNTAQGAGGSQASPLTFNVNRAGITEASFIANSSGAFFGVDVYNPTRGTTGPIGTTGSTIPDGGTTATLLGLSMLGLGFLKSRRR